MFGIDEETAMMGHLLLCRLPAGESSVCIAQLIRCHCFVLRFSSPSLPLLLFLLFSLSCRSASYMPDLNRNYNLRAPSWIIYHLSFLCVCFVIMCIHSDSCFADYLAWYVLVQVTMVERRSATCQTTRSSSWIHTLHLYFTIFRLVLTWILSNIAIASPIYTIFCTISNMEQL